MANFVRPPRGDFAPGDIHVHVAARESVSIQRLFVCVGGGGGVGARVC